MEPADVEKLVQEAIKLTAGQQHIQEELRLLQAKLRFGRRGKGPRTRWHNDRLVCHAKPLRLHIDAHASRRP